MQWLPVGSDGRLGISPDTEDQSVSPRECRSASAWLWSLVFHALLATFLMIPLAPSPGHPGKSGGAVGMISAYFVQQSATPRGSIGNVDTRVSDVVPVNAIASSRRKHTVEPAVSFRTVDVDPWREEPPRDSSKAEDLEPLPPPRKPDRTANRTPDSQTRRISRSSQNIPDEVPGQEVGVGAAPLPSHSGDASPGNLSRNASTPGTPAGNSHRPMSAAAGRERGKPGTSFFGVQGDGKKFVYVIDCSASMSARETYAHARQELLTSLDQLPATALIQVIYYNDQPHAAAGGQKPALVRNTSAERRKIRQFSQGVVAGGGTRHLPALELALALEPDAIFWLTDADEPLLNDSEMRQIHRLNRRRIPLHAIEFGFGPALGIDNFLKRVSRESDGEHRYYDLGERAGSP